MSDQPLPPELAKWSNLPWLRYVGRPGKDEWHAACPQCGETDHKNGTGKPNRFHIHPTDRGGPACGVCRKCGYFEWGDDQKLSDPEKVKAYRARLAQLDEEARKFHEGRLQWLNSATWWRDCHDNMTRDQRKLWRGQGIADWAIDFHGLGFSSGEKRGGPALTIPYWDNTMSALKTLQFRLLEPPDESDRYRFISGTYASWFFPWPTDEIGPVVLVLEGAKKSLVVYDMVRDGLRYRGKPLTIVATPSKEPKSEMVAELDKAETIIWLLDPDATKPTIANGRELPPSMDRNVLLAGKDRSLVAWLPEKVDDLILAGHLDAPGFQAVINQAGPWWIHR